MKTPQQIDDWITAVVKKELKKIPAIVLDAAKRLNRLELISHQVSRRTGINTETIETILKRQ